MPYTCSHCDFFDTEGAHKSTCPSCGGRMRMTMFDPRGTATATLEPPAKAAWKDPYAYGYEEIEAPWAFRYAQIGVGVSAYFFVWRWGQRIMLLLYGTSLAQMPKNKAAMTVAVAVFAMNCIAALVGGGAAGFWARNWIVQGLGVAVGVLVIPLVGMLIVAPESWKLFAVNLAATSVLALVGAFLGHLLVKPTRVVNS